MSCLNQSCPTIGQRLVQPDNSGSCPVCGTHLVKFKRKTGYPAHLKVAEIAGSSVPGNHGGKWWIFQSPADGTLTCDCFSFLRQNGVKTVYWKAIKSSNRQEREDAELVGHIVGTYVNEEGRFSLYMSERPVDGWIAEVTCKHTRDARRRNPTLALPHNTAPVSPYQTAGLRRAKIGRPVNRDGKIIYEQVENLSYGQAYFVNNQLFGLNGENFNTFKTLESQGGPSGTSSIGTRFYGVEIECTWTKRINADAIAQKITEAGRDIGLSCNNRGYTHELSAGWKIVSDSSIHMINGDYGSMEGVSPKLYMKPGLEQIDKFCEVIASEDVCARVNKSCGCHNHFDISSWDNHLRWKLVAAYKKVEYIMNFLVPASRRVNNYCKQLSSAYFEQISTSGMHNDRYYAVNLTAFQRHKTVEWRLPGGSVKADKIKNNLLTFLGLVEAVENGATKDDFDGTDIEQFFDTIGYKDNAVSILKACRAYQVVRFNEFISVSKEQIWSSTPAALKEGRSIENMPILRKAELVAFFGGNSSAVNFVQMMVNAGYAYDPVISIDSLETSLEAENRRRHFRTIFNSPSSSDVGSETAIGRAALRRPTRNSGLHSDIEGMRTAWENATVSGNERTISIPATRTNSRGFNVTIDLTNDTIRCDCNTFVNAERAFIRGQSETPYCNHIIAPARWALSLRRCNGQTPTN